MRLQTNATPGWLPRASYLLYGMLAISLNFVAIVLFDFPAICSFVSSPVLLSCLASIFVHFDPS